MNEMDHSKMNIKDENGEFQRFNSTKNMDCPKMGSPKI
jgi:hypothetical protein